MSPKSSSPRDQMLAVLALWRLLRTWRVPHVSVALGSGPDVPAGDGTVSYETPGNLFRTRLWQGKVILQCVPRGRAGWLLLRQRSSSAAPFDPG